MACAWCNLAKSKKTRSVDPLTGNVVKLFNPRKNRWDDHFRWSSDHATLEGLTPTGRATVAALNMNDPFLHEARQLWFQEGWLP